MFLRKQVLRIAGLVAATGAVVGCGQPEEISSYTVPKEAPPIAAGDRAGTTGGATANPAAASAAPTDRMLAAILPDGQRAWFFKVVGPVAAMEKHAPAIAEFFASVRPSGKGLPEWKLPAGWTQHPGNEFRAATIVISGDRPLDLTVSTLGWPGTPDAMLANINRWRGQLGLSPIELPQLADTTSELKAGDATMTVVDLRGHIQSGMMPPFAGGAPLTRGAPLARGEPASADGNQNPSPSTDALPDGHPPVAPGTNADTSPSAAEVPTYEAPDSWKASSNSEFSTAAFDLADGPLVARVTVSVFPAAAPMIADPLANVNRWRNEIGLASVDKAGLEKVLSPVEVGGYAALSMVALPDAAQPAESQAAKATLAVMVPAGSRIWFFKLTGDRDLVKSEQKRFEDFVKSVRFKAGRGATDGN